MKLKNKAYTINEIDTFFNLPSYALKKFKKRIKFL